MMDLHFKADPVILTFTNPVSAYHALAPFEQWAAAQQPRFNVYDINGPLPPVAREYTGLGSLVWSNIYPPTGQVGYVPSWDNSIIYENKTTINCKYKIKGTIQYNNATGYYSVAREIIAENKKRQGFTKFEAWTYAVQVENGIPLAWGNEGLQSARMYWTPALESEWL